MFRRLFWLVAGVALGLWGRRKTIDAVERHVPAPVRRNAMRAFREARVFVADVAASRESAKRAAAAPPVRDVNGRLRD